MPIFGETTASLRFFGDDLIPSEVSELLGMQPTDGWAKGDDWHSGGKLRARRTGAWLRKVANRVPGDLDGQIAELLDGLATDFGVWEELGTRFRADVYCGGFMFESNEGIEIAPSTSTALGLRHLALGLDVYSDMSPKNKEGHRVRPPADES